MIEQTLKPPRVILPLRRWILGAVLLSLTGTAAGVASAAQTHTVRSGDTLSQVARNAGTSVAALLKLNGLTGTTLQPGQVIRLGPASVSPVQPVQKLPPLPAATPRPNSVRVSGPKKWATPPPATVTSFIGWALPGADSPFGNELPVRTYLPGLGFSMQTYNNCGPSALSAVLGFFKVNIGQNVIQRTARPNGGYMQISAIAPELRKFKLRTLAVRGGQLSQVKRLLALGIPVIVLQWYEYPGQVPHFRVVRGYDDQAGLVWVSDSMVGPLAYMSYHSFNALWNTQSRQMFPVYPEGYDKLVRRLVGQG
ncbi:LysM peptidoglycan-binding domain-containing protein [Deinococcus marmoris]|uniref:LysM peptidoglycan-binding domain-containing protein n=1 Tax=Deinococcus marmoris TaxID=249408 RepID=UPI0009DE5024|nr:LysM peptidoglycan-binding domain-containing protein [Deinococcus marmoris]